MSNITYEALCAMLDRDNGLKLSEAERAMVSAMETEIAESHRLREAAQPVASKDVRAQLRLAENTVASLPTNTPKARAEKAAAQRELDGIKAKAARLQPAASRPARPAASLSEAQQRYADALKALDD